uniref:phage tail tape measure protein n=1 Tax=Serratia entomophila TaxID=42906 RepID=UPI0021BDD338|nr:phage tail tape measure protein [Serratia entomophila]
MPPFINPVSPRKAVLICSVLTLCECWEMADTALLVVGLQLNDTNFKNKLTAAYRTAGEQSAKFNRQAQQDAKKTDESYQRIGGTLGGLAGKLAGLAGVELSLQGLAATSRQYGQALTELASITVAATAQMKQLDDAARQASSASGEGGSRTEEVLKLAGGLNDSAAAWRDQAAAASGAAQATAGVGAASRVANLALGALGGPVGVAIQAGLAMLYFHEQNQLARQSALALKDAIIETVPALALMSDKQLAVKQLDYNEQLKTLFDEKKQLQRNETYLKTRIEQANKAGWIGSILFGKPEDRKDELTRTAADMESMDKAIEKAKRNLDNVNSARFLAYTQLGQRISQFESDVNAMITPDQPKDNEVAAVTPAYSLGRLEADQSGREKQQEQYQKLLQQLAEQYAPGQTTVRKKQEVSKELKALYDGRLLTEREYQTASQMQRQETTRQRLKAETDGLAAPRLSIADDVDPAARLNNQLVQQQAQYQAYYQQGYLDKQRYEQLMQAATQESTDAQYQQALSLYGGQNRVHKMALGLVDMTRERTSGMMFDLLTGTQNFKQSMLGLFSSITQSVVQQLIDIAMQALLTRTILSTFMNIGGGVLGGAAGSGAMGMPTGWQGYVPNARGGIYASPSLSAYSGQVVSSPTLFAFARGAGLMGEAGPEAIMPLKRGADGSLGVRAIGGSQQAAAAPNVYITIENGGNVSTQADAGWGEFGKQMGNIAAQESQKVINRNLMPGQPIWKAIKGM